MKEILRSTDPVALSYVQAVLRDAGLNPLLLDEHTSIMEGSIGAIPRRIMVVDDEFDEASNVIAQMKKDQSGSL